jgi:hypothetical protein
MILFKFLCEKKRTNRRIENRNDVMSDTETDSTEEIDAHALITTLYSDQRKAKKEKD